MSICVFPLKLVDWLIMFSETVETCVFKYHTYFGLNFDFS